MNTPRKGLEEGQAVTVSLTVAYRQQALFQPLLQPPERDLSTSRLVQLGRFRICTVQRPVPEDVGQPGTLSPPATRLPSPSPELYQALLQHSWDAVQSASVSGKERFRRKVTLPQSWQSTRSRQSQI